MSGVVFDTQIQSLICSCKGCFDSLVGFHWWADEVTESRGCPCRVVVVAVVVVIVVVGAQSGLGAALAGRCKGSR